MYSNFGDRLKIERRRLNKSQEEFGKLGGVGKNTQLSYEKNTHTPKISYLENLKSAGVDTDYLLTGQRKGTDSVDVLPHLINNHLQASQHLFTTLLSEPENHSFENTEERLELLLTTTGYLKQTLLTALRAIERAETWLQEHNQQETPK